MYPSKLRSSPVRQWSVALVASLAPAWAQLSIAQEAAGQDAESRAIEEILVTAQRREQSLSQVSIAVAAFDNDTLVKQGIDDLANLAASVPGFDIFRGNGSNNPTLALRGVGTTNPWINNNQSVAAYVDDAYLPFSSYLTFPMFDMQRIEVLKGPQVGLYGRNATAGAINFVTNKPGTSSGNYVDVSYDEYEKVDVEGAIGGAISETIGVRIAGKYEYGGGYIDRFGTLDTTAGFTREPGVIPEVEAVGPVSDYGDRDLFALRGSLDAQLVEDVDMFLTYHYGRDESELIGSTNTNGDILGVFVPPDGTPYVDYDDARPNTDTEQQGGVFRINVQFGSSEFSSITSYESLDRNYVIGDFVPTRIAEPRFSEDATTLSQEFLLMNEGDGGRVWLFGAHFSRDEIEYARDLVVTDLLLGTLASSYVEDDEAWAVFGHGEFPLSDAFMLTAGLRYTDESKEYSGGSVAEDPYGTSIVGAFWPETAPPGVFGNPTYDEDNVAGKLAVNWTPNDASLFYLSVSKGFKSGGFDGSGITEASQLTPYKSEQLWAYELGTKTRFESIDTSLYASAFFYDYTDKQVLALVDLGTGVAEAIIQNAASSDVTGLDVDLDFGITRNLRLALSATWLDTEVTEWDSADPDEVADRTGNELPGSPGLSATASLVWFLPVSRGLELESRLWATYTDGSYRDIVNTPELRSDDRTVTNVRVELAGTNDAFSLYMYSYNVFDEEYVTSVRSLAGMLGNYYGAPRQTGAGVTFRF